MQVIFHLYTECNSMCLGVSRIFYFKFAICTLYIFVYVLSDSMPFVSVLSDCALFVHCMCAEFDCA